MNKKHTFVNLGAQGIAFAVSFCISFFITPRIISAVGKETYGYLGLANSFSGYITVVTVALNALAGRFVTINLHQDKHEEASQYFSSVFLSNMIITLALLPASLLMIFNLEQLMDLPAQSVLDIKLTFVFVFASFFVNLLGSIFSVATFATNKIYLASIRNIEANTIRIILVLILFAVFSPRISYVSGALLCANVFTVYTNICYTKKLLPQIKISHQLFCKDKVKELITSGCWNSITALSNMLLEGLDLLISNFFISSSAMGLVAIVKTIPNMLNQCLSALLNVFLPQLTIDYAKSNRENMIHYLDSSCKLIGILFSMPVAFVIVFGIPFFRLWMPTEDANLLWMLSLLSLAGLYFAGSVNILYNLYTVTNKLKIPAMITLLSGVLNTLVVLLLLNTTDFGIIAVVSVSSVIGILRNLLFNIPYSAHCIGERSGIFYRIALKSVGMVGIVSVCGWVINNLFHIDSWLALICSACAMCIIGFSGNLMIFYNRTERAELRSIFMQKFRRNAT